MLNESTQFHKDEVIMLYYFTLQKNDHIEHMME